MPRIRRAISCPRPGGSSPTGRRPKALGDGVTVRNDTGVYEGGEISIYYDPMIAKLVTHAPTREAAIEAQARRARRLRDRRHPPQHPVPLGADGASALARGQAVDRLHRRGISGRLPGRRSRRARLRTARRRRGRHRPRARRAQAADLRPAARGTSRFAFERERVVVLGRRAPRRRVEVEDRGPASRVAFADGAQPALSSRDWRPGEPVWTRHGRRRASRRAGAADPQRLSLAHARRRRRRRGSTRGARPNSPR